VIIENVSCGRTVLCNYAAVQTQRGMRYVLYSPTNLVCNAILTGVKEKISGKNHW